MPRHRRLDGDLGGLLIAHFTDHDHVRVLAQNGPERRRKADSCLAVHRNLRNPAELVLDRVLDGDDLLGIRRASLERSIQRRRLAAPRRSGHQDHPVRATHQFRDLGESRRRHSKLVKPYHLAPAVE